MLNKTSVLSLILRLNKYKTICFLCLKSHNNMSSIHTDLNVIGESFNINLTLANMMKNLFPSHDILFDQACKDCADLILKIYVMLHNFQINKTVLNMFVDGLDKNLKNIDPNRVDKVVIQTNTLESKENEEKLLTISSNNKSGIFNCIKCEMSFNSKKLLQEHKISLHSNTDKSIICDKCGQKFKTPQSLKAHLNCHIEKECPYCFKKLKSHSHYNLHIQGHKTGKKRKRNKLKYNCNDCNYQTINKKTLEAHINKVHLNIRPYVCQTCFKGFYKKSNLIEHLNTHSQNKRETCEICGDNFVNQRTLIQHQRLHSNLKPYECAICSKKFITSGRRLEHMKRIHMEKAESCIFCDKKFSLKRELNRHVKKVHSANTLALLSNNYDELGDKLFLPIM